MDNIAILFKFGYSFAVYLDTLDNANKTGSSWMKVLISVSALLFSKSWYFL